MPFKGGNVNITLWDYHNNLSMSFISIACQAISFFSLLPIFLITLHEVLSARLM